MPPNKKNNDTKTDDEISIKDTSSKLDISEATVRKYIKDFDLELKRANGTKAVISMDTFEALSEIAKLRANGLSIQEIKELKKEQPSKHILDEIEETQKDKKEEHEEAVTEKTLPLEENTEIEGKDLEEKTEETHEETGGREAQEEEEQEERSEGEGEPQEGQGERRRRIFNYRYVERQISNDSKRVGSLRLRLRNPNLSVQERLFFEEALERRILFLNGWKHILRWVSTK